jgi:hypothetical protein
MTFSVKHTNFNKYLATKIWIPYETTTLLMAFYVTRLNIFEMLYLSTFQNIFYQGHRHQYSSNTRICI